MASKTGLRLLAQTTDDLAVISAACQDAVFQRNSLAYDRTAHRFTLEVNRFRWESVPDGGKRADGYDRIRSVIAFDSVLVARSRGLPPRAEDMIFSLLSISFEPDDEPPGGTVHITLAGGADISLTVECLDATLLDSSASWKTARMPGHPTRD